MKKTLSLLVALVFILSGCSTTTSHVKSNNSSDWFPASFAEAKYNKPINVRDTDGALGRYSIETKEIGVRDLSLIHGHACDGLVIVFVETKAVLNKLFPDGVVDRTDLRVVSKNGPCWVDTVAFMTGARINFKTLKLDKNIGNGFIIQRISTGEAYDVHLKPGVFPVDQTALEEKIRDSRSKDKAVSAKDIDTDEKMANTLILKLLNTAPEELLDIKPVKDFKFIPNDSVDVFGDRGDIINKDMPRT